eukprot:jgi/Ulvmu1/6264/UM028_0122.1
MRRWRLQAGESQCGDLNQPCCDGDQDSEQCPQGYTDEYADYAAFSVLGCSAGMCVICGGDGQPCCKFKYGSTACDDGAVCLTNGLCQYCGGLGQFCCGDSDDVDGDLMRRCPYAGNAMCSQGVCTACGRPGEPCCKGDDYGRITGQGTEATDKVCWSGAACPASKICPDTPVPPATPADVELCTGNYSEINIEVEFEGIYFDACMAAAANTECKDTVLVDPAGSRIIPEWCLDYTGNRSTAVFECPSGAPDLPPAQVSCSETLWETECGHTFCEGGDFVCPTGGWVPGKPSAYNGRYALKPGQVAVVGGGGVPSLLVALACDGSLHTLNRPGNAKGWYSVWSEGAPHIPLCLSLLVCFSPDVPATTGTTVAWVATPATADPDDATLYTADVDISILDDGMACIAPGVSYWGKRTRSEISCQMQSDVMLPLRQGDAPPAAADAPPDSQTPPANPSLSGTFGGPPSLEPPQVTASAAPGAAGGEGGADRSGVGAEAGRAASTQTPGVLTVCGLIAAGLSALFL